LKLKNKIILVTRLVLISSFLFADVNDPNVLTTKNEIAQDFCCEENTCVQDGFGLLFHNDEINSIASLNISTDYQTRDNYNIDYPNLPESVTMSRDGETIYQFTNCGQTGRYGPSQSQANSTYSGTSLDGSVTVTGGIQYWTVPSTGNYTIEAWGAQGGRSNDGKGAYIKGEFNLTAGTVLKILVGQAGTSHSYAMSGGGGSFVAFADNTPKIVAGGGGGWRNTYEGIRPQTSDGTISNNGNPGYANNANLNNGGTNGNGGWTTTPWSHGGGGGAGFYGNGDASNDNRGGTALPPMSFVNGGVGGLTPSN
jgi:hypothetical protein